MPFRRRSLWLLLLLLVLLLTACQPAAEEPTPLPPTSEPVQPAPTATLAPPKTLVVCLRQEPSTLYVYGGSSQSMWSVLEAVYDGPFDSRQFGVQPVILEKLPDFENGDAAFAAQDVAAGDLVVDADGKLVALEKGVQVLPAGCSGQDCVISWDGNTPLQMERLELKFLLLPGLTWSDGAPLTAADSVYSFDLSNDPATPVSREVIARTASYAALDDLTVQWIGLPGYFPQRYQTLFWLPLPAHAWNGLTAAELLTAEVSSQKPLGWGPYVVDEWVEGDHIQLSKNTAYFRAEEDLPRFDVLVYRFLGEYTDSNLTALLNEECDVVDQAAMVDDDLDVVLQLQQNNEIQSWIAPSTEWEHLDFGIVPAAYDDGYNAFIGDRPDFFGDLRTRQAFTMCMNRQGIVTRWLWDQSSVPVSYVAASHPLALTDQAPLAYDPIAGAQLLDQVGWKDFDGDPATPRVAAGVAGVPDGTPLSVNYATTKAYMRIEVAKYLVASMTECGIQVNVQYYDPAELYAPGPDGIVFGRKFDLVQYAWGTGSQPPCLFYESEQTPSPANNWLGINVTGYSSPDFDAACQTARTTRIDQTDAYAENHINAARLFAADLPVVPLYYRTAVTLARPDMCGLDMDVTARSALWNLEAFGYGETCP
ncbi:MAG: hypothetical protein K8R77_09215 [Anaerolineaceae bacterium]|nr:hypothetical protein [Anaerolineaceae bacterium]